MKLWTVIGMSVAATIVVPTALALPPTAIQDSHDRADVPRTPALVVSRDGFDWGDAAIGVVSGMGFALLLAGLAVLTVVTRTKTRLSTR